MIWNIGFVYRSWYKALTSQSGICEVQPAAGMMVGTKTKFMLFKFVRMLLKINRREEKNKQGTHTHTHIFKNTFLCVCVDFTSKHFPFHTRLCSASWPCVSLVGGTVGGGPVKSVRTGKPALSLTNLAFN